MKMWSTSSQALVIFTDKTWWREMITLAHILYITSTNKMISLFTGKYTNKIMQQPVWIDLCIDMHWLH